MSMGELQKYSHDNRTQVVSFAKPPVPYLDQMGITQSQNEGLYQLLAKNLESKGSVAIVRLQTLGANRGIVIVALPGESLQVRLSSSAQTCNLPGQTKLVGLVFLSSPLPPRTPASASTLQAQGQQGPMQQQQQQAMQLLDIQQQQAQYQQQQQQQQPQAQLNPQHSNQSQQVLQQINNAQQSYQQYQQPQLQQIPQSSPYASYSQPPSAFSVPSGPNTAANPGFQLSDMQIQEMFQNLQRQQSGQM